MITFIVIGRNVENTIQICIESIYKSVAINGLSDYEILYVDSSSTDRTLSLLTAYPDLRKYLIVTGYNPAVARNIGAKESKGGYLVFLDGDMELIPDFLTTILDSEKRPKYKFVSGDLVNYFYEYRNFSFINALPYFGHKLDADRIETIVGGVFCIDKRLYQSVDGMREYFVLYEDYDLGLRLARKGIFLTRLKEVFVNHHTISYMSFERMKDMLRKGNFLYAGLLNRKHLTNKYFWKVLIRSSYTLLCLFGCLVLLPFLGIIALLPYFLLILLRSALQKNRVSYNFGYFCMYFILKDFQELWGTFFFFPSKNGKVKYILLR